MNKKVRFTQHYKIKIWTPKKSEEYNKTNRFERIDTRKEIIPIEEELVQKHETNYEINTRELNSNRITERDKIVKLGNPFMKENNYLEDLRVQDNFLRPQNSNISSKDNKYLKTD
jgi:hypothetical protein